MIILCAQDRIAALEKLILAGNTHLYAGLFDFGFSQGYIIPLQVQPDPSTTRHDTSHTIHFFAYTPIRIQKNGNECCARIWDDDDKKRDKAFEGVEGRGEQEGLTS
jgi:hypothetical protein